MSETVTFIASAAPPLADGTYTVSVTQTVSLVHTPADPGEVFTNSVTFAVQGPHFQLPPGMVFRVTPAQQAQGDFSQSLPSLSLSDPTLPWQRTVELKDGATPWLALLVFDQSDPPPPVQTGAVADLQNPSEDDVFCPAPVLGLGEDSSTPVTYIDVPAYLFNTIAPSASDIAWLSHVETVTDPGNGSGSQPVQNGVAPPVTTAVLIGNRFAMAGRETTVHLVSFEGWDSALAPTSGQVTMTGGKAFARVVSLYHWGFGSNGSANTLSAMASNLSVEPLRRPAMPLLILPAVADALALGYTAMNHTLRDGSATVSWYRGPLMPQPVSAFAGQPVAATDPDALLRYDPTTGLFDTSYAAAFTLGWLLALNNGGYTAAYYRWLSAIAQLQAQAVETQTLQESLALTGAAGDGARKDGGQQDGGQNAAVAAPDPVGGTITQLAPGLVRTIRRSRR